MALRISDNDVPSKDAFLIVIEVNLGIRSGGSRLTIDTANISPYRDEDTNKSLTADSDIH